MPSNMPGTSLGSGGVFHGVASGIGQGDIGFHGVASGVGQVGFTGTFTALMNTQFIPGQTSNMSGQAATVTVKNGLIVSVQPVFHVVLRNIGLGR